MNNSYRIQYNRKISSLFLLALLAHVPLFLFMASFNGHSILQTLMISAAVLALPTALFMMKDKSNLLPNVLAFATMSFSALLIHLGNGMIEMHFHIFVFLAALIAFGMITPVLTGVVTIAAHHLLFFFLLPKSIFNYEASIWIVLLHALFVVVEAAPVLYISHRFKKLIDLQDRVLGKLSTISHNMAQFSESLAESGASLSKSTMSTAASLEETSASLEELSSIIKNNTESARTAEVLSKESQVGATSGNREISDLVEAIKKIQSSSTKIEEITHVIDDIAFQTNLLALNASVEAARAGEHGKGFAVVADAVRTLAQKSAVSAKDITHLIKQSSEQIASGASLAEGGGKALESIVNKASKVATLNEEISRGSTEQSQGIQQITEAVQRLDTAAQENSQASETISSSAQQISTLANELNEMVGILNKEIGMKAS